MDSGTSGPRGGRKQVWRSHKDQGPQGCRGSRLVRKLRRSANQRLFQYSTTALEEKEDGHYMDTSKPKWILTTSFYMTSASPNVSFTFR